MIMKLYQLRYFTAVCRYGYVTKAAEELHVTQPSVSSAIKELEDEFSVNLFHRINNRLSPMNCSRLCRQYKKAPGVGIFSFSRSSAASAAPLLSVNAFCFEDRKEIFRHCVVIRVPTS